MVVMYCIISFIIGALIMMCAIGLVSLCKDKEPRNNVHFYVARDKDETLWLYLGKPLRKDESFECYAHSKIISHSRSFEDLGLNINDYKDLKWKDEPVEVFLNLEDCL